MYAFMFTLSFTARHRNRINEEKNILGEIILCLDILACWYPRIISVDLKLYASLPFVGKWFCLLIVRVALILNIEVFHFECVLHCQ